MPKEIPPATFPYSSRHNLNCSCAFHAGYITHSTEDCGLFKAKVQELIDQKILSFYEEQPNLKINHLPVHYESTINVIEEEECIELVREVAKVNIPMTFLLKKLQEYGFLEGLYDGCIVYEIESGEYVELKSYV